MSTNIKSTPDLRMIPLGLFSIGVGLFIVGGEFIGGPGVGAYIAFGLFTAGIGALITGYWAFRADNIFGGVAQSIIGAFFISFAMYDWLFYSSAKDPYADLAWGAAAAAIVVGMIAFASFKASIPRLASVTLLGLFLFLVFLWAANAFHSMTMLLVSGVIAILTAIMAWIGGLIRLLASL
ncbi:MAG TPA: GPR1/FUN34/YaaH family transporter [Candidatus Eremiobacteraceae bacterium]|nr:GPR1/FUN34/YaaH family transporter [Candidatus Eremiobacteraceae bacterium]